MRNTTLILLNYNQTDYTVKCLNSILKSKYKNFNIVLIDNGSSLKNFVELKENISDDSRLKLLRLDINIGYVGGINVGLKEGAKLHPDYFLILNNDTILDENAISKMINTCESFNKKAIITGKVYHYDEPNKLQDVGYSYLDKKALKFKRLGLDEIDTGQYDQISERDMLDDVFWLFPSKLYVENGGYSPYFWFNAEQADFALRAKQIGYKLVYTPDAKLWHKGSVSIGGRERNPKLAYWHIQSTLIFRYRHLSKIQFIFQYFKIIKEILASYSRTVSEKLKGNKIDFKYPNAKLKGLFYFNRWVFVRNENTGHIPF